MLTCGQRRGLQLCRVLCHCHIRDFLEPTLEASIAHTELIYALLHIEVPQLHAHLVEADMLSHFAISWILTWFTHDVDELSTIVRVYDACLASHPFFPTYISAAIVMANTEMLLALPADLSQLHKALLDLPKTADFDEVIANAYGLFHKHSPTVLIKSPAISEKGRELLAQSKAATAFEQFTADPTVYAAAPDAVKQRDPTIAIVRAAICGAATFLSGTLAIAAIEVVIVRGSALFAA